MTQIALLDYDSEEHPLRTHEESSFWILQVLYQTLLPHT